MKQQRRSRRITFAVIAVVVVGGLFAWSTFQGGDSTDDNASDTTTTTAGHTGDATGLDVVTNILALNEDDPSSGLGGAPSRTVTVNSVEIKERAGTGDTTTTAAAGDAFEYGDGECAPDTKPAEPVIDFDAAPQKCIDPTKQYIAVFDTTEGKMRVLLDTANTPGTVNNFVNLAKFGYYDGTTIFRTDTSIEIVQGGSPHTNDPSDPGPGYTISDEGTGFTYEPGQLVMARSSGEDSAGAQFFFVAGDAASNLDAQGTYVVFGNIIDDSSGDSTTTSVAADTTTTAAP